jgi:2-oxoglutarate ferredoxin oxidoreductase subunit beta
MMSKKDFESNQDVRWCPGCGDYAVLNQIQKLLPSLGVPRENYVFISGIGCSSRFPYYMETYGMHGIHGRAPAIASGLKISRPELSVWVITGDGDSLAIGGNHLIHVLRRNVGIKVVLLNNKIYGLTKGQYSPTSEFGKKTKTTPHGSIDRPFNPVSLALGAGATFVARSVDVELEHLGTVLRRAALHPGTALVEVLQNCNVFNDGAYGVLTDKAVKAESRVLLEQDKPMIFGKKREKGIRLGKGGLEVVALGDGVRESDLLVHDERAGSPGVAFAVAQMSEPRGPVPLGIFRAMEEPSYEALDQRLAGDARKARGRGQLVKLLAGGESWTIG